MKRSGFADLPLHGGHVPLWLAERMTKLGAAITENILHHYGTSGLFSRLSDPFWFQALGTVMGMIRSFAALGDSGGGEAAAKLSQGISEALYNTALGIGTSAISIIMYNVFTTKIDGITYGIDESGFTLTQSFASLYK